MDFQSKQKLISTGRPRQNSKETTHSFKVIANPNPHPTPAQTKASPHVIADGSDDAKDQWPAGPQAVPLALEDLQDTLQLFLPNVCVKDIRQLLQGVEQQKLQPLGSRESRQLLTGSAY